LRLAIGVKSAVKIGGNRLGNEARILLNSRPETKASFCRQNWKIFLQIFLENKRIRDDVLSSSVALLKI